MAKDNERPYMLVTTGWGYRPMWSHIVSFPAALMLWPIAVYQYKRRNPNLIEKEYLWIEGWLFHWGWVVTEPPSFRYL